MIRLGPSSVPWGTPEITGDHSEQLPLNTTRCLLFVKKFLIHSYKRAIYPMPLQFQQQTLMWHTVESLREI